MRTLESPGGSTRHLADAPPGPCAGEKMEGGVREEFTLHIKMSITIGSDHWFGSEGPKMVFMGRTLGFRPVFVEMLSNPHFWFEFNEIL